MQAPLGGEDVIEGLYRATEFAIHRPDQAGLGYIAAQCIALCWTKSGRECWATFGEHNQLWLERATQQIELQIASSPLYISSCWKALGVHVACAAAMLPPSPAMSLCTTKLLLLACPAASDSSLSRTDFVEVFTALQRTDSVPGEAHSAWLSHEQGPPAEAEANASHSWSVWTGIAATQTQIFAAAAFASTGVAVQVLPQAWAWPTVALLAVASAAVLLGQGGTGRHTVIPARQATRAYLVGGIMGQVYRSTPCSAHDFPQALGELKQVQVAGGDLTLPPPLPLAPASQWCKWISRGPQFNTWIQRH
jgi:hypothetical protein